MAGIDAAHAVCKPASGCLPALSHLSLDAFILQLLQTRRWNKTERGEAERSQVSAAGGSASVCFVLMLLMVQVQGRVSMPLG